MSPVLSPLLSRRLSPAAALLSLTGCVSNDAAAPGIDAGLDHTTTFVEVDAGAGTDGSRGADAALLQTTVRVVLLSPLDYGVDICLPGPGGTFYGGGPLLDLPSNGDAGADARQKATGGHDAAHEASRGPPDADRRDATHPRDATRAEEGGDRDARASDHDSGHGARDGGGAAQDAAVDGGRDAGRPLGGGVTYQHVSLYRTVKLAGTLELTIVKGGSTDCTSAVLAVQRVTLEAGKFATLVVTAGSLAAMDAGRRDDAASRTDASFDAGPPLSLAVAVLTDEPAVSSTELRARFFNATAAGDAGRPVPLGVAAIGTALAGGTLSVPLAVEVPVDQVSVQNPRNPSVDTLGYFSGPALVSATPIELVMTSAEDAGARPHKDGGPVGPTSTFSPAGSSSLTLDLDLGTNHTGFLVGPIGAATLVWCEDSVVNEGGVTVVNNCAVIPQQ